MINFLGKTLIVSAAIVAVPIVLIKKLKKLDDEGFFDCKQEIEETDKTYIY